MSDENTTNETETTDASTVAFELARASKLWPEAGEAEDAYALRVLRVVQDLSEEEFKGIPENAQGWFDSAVLAFNENAALPPLDGYTDLFNHAEDQRPEPRVSKPDPEKTKTKRAAKKAAKKKGKGKAAASEANGARGHGDGKVAQMMEEILKNPKISVKDIQSTLATRNVTVQTATVTQVRSAFRHAIDFLQKKGLLNQQIHL